MTQNGIFIIRPDLPGQACIKFREGEREVSVSCDDSCGALSDYSRTDVRCFMGANFEDDVTLDVFKPPDYDTTVHCSLDALETALAWLRQPHVEHELEVLKQVLADAVSERGLEKLTEQLAELRAENARLRVRVAALKTVSFGALYGASRARSPEE